MIFTGPGKRWRLNVYILYILYIYALYILYIDTHHIYYMYIYTHYYIDYIYYIDCIYYIYILYRIYIYIYYTIYIYMHSIYCMYYICYIYIYALNLRAGLFLQGFMWNRNLCGIQLFSTWRMLCRGRTGRRKSHGREKEELKCLGCGDVLKPPIC